MSNANQEDNGQSFIPASQRPDGTWRKARRVKEGYVPQEEVPLYEPKGKKFMGKQTPSTEPVRLNGFIAHASIPGLFIEEDQAAKKEKKKLVQVEQVTKDIHKLNIKAENNQKSVLDPTADPAKKLKNLKKRLREVEALALKIKSGQIEKPEPDQLIKVGRKNELILQIHELEKLLQ